MKELIDILVHTFLTGNIQVLTALSLLSVLVQCGLFWVSTHVAKNISVVRDNHLAHMQTSLDRIDKKLDDHVLWHVEEARAFLHRELTKREFITPGEHP